MLTRLVQRLAILGLGVLSIWLIVFVVFDFANNRLPWILALSATYGVGAYVILPRVVRMGLKIAKRRRVPRYTITGDGLPGDPVNVVLLGRFAELRAAFAAAGWTEPEPLSLRSSVHMARSFVFKTPYPNAPFSTLYLFGRGQDIGFQKPIDDSPRKRHHVRFWALGLAYARTTVGTSSFWLNTDRPPEGDRVLWVGAGTRDTGFALTKLTFQITHATDSDTNAERDYIIHELKTNGVIGDVTSYRAGDQLITEQVNHYITDGDVAAAALAEMGPASRTDERAPST